MKIKFVLLIICILSFVLSCKTADETPESVFNGDDIELTNIWAGVQDYQSSWDLKIWVKANNISDFEGFICKIEIRFMKNEITIATVDNITEINLPGARQTVFSTDSDWHLFPYGSSLILCMAVGNDQFLGGQRPEKVEITLYFRKGSSQGVPDFSKKTTTQLIYNN